MRPSDSLRSIIRSLCEERLISTRALCRKAGINRATLTRFLNGSGRIRLEQLESVLDVLGHDLDAVPKDAS